MKYKLANGWTKETVMERVKKYNNGKQSWDNIREECSYLSPDGNRCAIGCFIPDEHAGIYYYGSVKYLLGNYPDLKYKMLFDDMDALRKFQFAHDSCKENQSVYESIQKFLDEEVE